MTLIFATNNQNKVNEIKSVLPESLTIISLKDAGIQIDIPEPHNTFEENAREKSSVIYKLTKQNCFSEDTGLEVRALNGAPGVRSARYAGDDANPEKNIDLLLEKMRRVPERNAQFKTVISLLLDRKEYFFTGVCRGTITFARKGTGGFGYDSIFIPEGETKTFGEMTLTEKNNFSHRKKAVMQLAAFLNEYNGKN